jgi:hypothetical protein
MGAKDVEIGLPEGFAPWQTGRFDLNPRFNRDTATVTDRWWAEIVRASCGRTFHYGRWLSLVISDVVKECIEIGLEWVAGTEATLHGPSGALGRVPHG